MGTWWLRQSRDLCHGYAYRRIADYLRESLPEDPRLIVDYACGAGNLLVRLALRFPGSSLTGLDGSGRLLSAAQLRMHRCRRDLQQRVSLIETPLPRFDLGIKADLAVFAFPNMVPFHASNPPGEESGETRMKTGRRQGLHCEDGLNAGTDSDGFEVAEFLAKASDPETEDETEDPEVIRCSLIQGRQISLNLRQMLRRGGFCARIEYSRVKRHEMSRLELMRVSFEEGALEIPVCGKRSLPWFRVIASSYFRSRVVLDVFEQSGDPRDQWGGYLITMLKAI